jgi:hypothetical protein
LAEQSRRKRERAEDLRPGSAPCCERCDEEMERRQRKERNEGQEGDTSERTADQAAAEPWR